MKKYLGCILIAAIGCTAASAVEVEVYANMNGGDPYEYVLDDDVTSAPAGADAYVYVNATANGYAEALVYNIDDESELFEYSDSEGLRTDSYTFPSAADFYIAALAQVDANGFGLITAYASLTW